MQFLILLHSIPTRASSLPSINPPRGLASDMILGFMHLHNDEKDHAPAGEKEVSLGGGASVAQQHLAAGLLDEIVVSVVPILLGGGARLFENVGDVKLEQVESVEAPGVTHIRYARA